ncbi:arsenate reductase family protein [Paenibacillus xerothermodurans]|uniref:Arsenate reductase family protein n=1 Tax=Paenibacillus xerothermodurans TaxID=1977292 RepID=A0A2W1N9N8_PAEXE|nr:arsenate reductase family protein [Paenibacillus xerothermodurans]PZE20370.1 arsenate reductase family protein [Paenibacillus xerothermodurans]
MSSQKTVICYQYPQCGTCRNAMKWLKQKGLNVEAIHIFDNPPSAEQLQKMIEQSGLEIKKWFNTSGEVYKAMNLKDKLPEMTDEQKIELLAANGRLIKRPIVTDGTKVTVGYKEETFEQVWGS